MNPTPFSGPPSEESGSPLSTPASKLLVSTPVAPESTAPSEPPATDWLMGAVPHLPQASPTTQYPSQAPIPSPHPPQYAPQNYGQQPPLPMQGDGTGGLIPYKNPKALTSYYVGLFSLVPVAALVMAPAAVYLGIQGLKYAKENPIVKGQAHAWVGIVCGVFWTIIHYGALIMFLGTVLFARS